jgi:hypothetical protein
MDIIDIEEFSALSENFGIKIVNYYKKYYLDINLYYEVVDLMQNKFRDLFYTN